MPIQFPQPNRSNPFDDYKWKRNAKPSWSQVQPNLAHVGFVFCKDSMSPGFGRPKTIRPNLRNLGKMFSLNSASYVNPVHLVERRLGTQNTQLTGISRDQNGDPLGFCQVLVFRTEDKSFQGETQSDANGNWSMPLLRGGPFFLVSYKAGSPDVAGTSVNTLVPDIM